MIEFPFCTRTAAEAFVAVALRHLRLPGLVLVVPGQGVRVRLNATQLNGITLAGIIATADTIQRAAETTRCVPDREQLQRYLAAAALSRRRPRPLNEEVW